LYEAQPNLSNSYASKPLTFTFLDCHPGVSP